MIASDENRLFGTMRQRLIGGDRLLFEVSMPYATLPDVVHHCANSVLSARAKGSLSTPQRPRSLICSFHTPNYARQKRHTHWASLCSNWQHSSSTFRTLGACCNEMLVGTQWFLSSFVVKLVRQWKHAYLGFTELQLATGPAAQVQLKLFLMKLARHQ